MNRREFLKSIVAAAVTPTSVVTGAAASWWWVQRPPMDSNQELVDAVRDMIDADLRTKIYNQLSSPFYLELTRQGKITFLDKAEEDTWNG